MIAKIKRKSRESGTIFKDWGGRESIAVVYPNSYWVGMSNLAVHQLYHLFNKSSKIVAERMFLNSDGHCRSIESNRSINEFKIAAFSFSFELDYLNIRSFFADNFNFKREDRNHFPVLIAGGPAVTLNPEALSEIFDLIILGEIEAIIEPLNKLIKAHLSYNDFIKTASKIKGVYAPGINEISDVKRVYLEDLDKIPTHSVIWTDETEFGHMHLIEISRGCPWKCKFCATPNLYSPYRVRDSDTIISSMEYGLNERRYIGIIGADILGHPSFKEISDYLINCKIPFSLSSLRAGRITKDIADILVMTGHKRMTLGVEAGSEKLRNLLDKSLTEENIFEAVINLAEAGITNLKLYFMVGLPNESEDDLGEIPNLIKQIRKLILMHRNKRTLTPNISAVISPFVPKKGTPFERVKFDGIKILQKKLKKLRASLGPIPNTKISGDSPKRAALEYKLSNGGSELADYILSK